MDAFVLFLQNLRQQILELLGPISMNHGAHFMAAIAYVWNERKQVKTPVRNKVKTIKVWMVSFCCSKEQSVGISISMLQLNIFNIKHDGSTFVCSLTRSAVRRAPTPAWLRLNALIVFLSGDSCGQRRAAAAGGAGSLCERHAY